MHHTSKVTRRVLVTVATTAALAAGALVTPTLGSASPLSGGVQQAKIESALAAKLAAGPSEFWVRFADTANLTAASQMTDWDARGQAVYDALTHTADTSQASVRAYLDSQHVNYEAFWAVNAIHVVSGTSSLATRLTAFGGVAGLQLSKQIELVKPVSSAAAPTGPDAPEWNIQNVNADDVWSQFGDRGEGIVVASIDTGVQYSHPALVNQYRGKKAKPGRFNHNYNWFDAYGSSQAPFDGNGHGTHTMGTMVGDDGGANQIGMAPKAKWIATNGCCGSESGLVASGQWLLAPTKLNHTHPKPGKRPDVVNNSWGYTQTGQQTLFDSIIAAWDAAGIFGQWANGNIGPSCNSSGAPGSRPQAYSAGAYDINNNIASFSSRGPGQSGDVKPNISAPGVNVRSSWPGSSYNLESGTSMASPHVAGAVALLWSAVPSLLGDVPGTKKALDNSATDKSDLQCGGTADDNNVYGEGRLDALKLVQTGLAQAKATEPAGNAISR